MSHGIHRNIFIEIRFGIDSIYPFLLLLTPMTSDHDTLGCGRSSWNAWVRPSHGMMWIVWEAGCGYKYTGSLELIVSIQWRTHVRCLFWIELNRNGLLNELPTILDAARIQTRTRCLPFNLWIWRGKYHSGIRRKMWKRHKNEMSCKPGGWRSRFYLIYIVDRGKPASNGIILVKLVLFASRRTCKYQMSKRDAIRLLPSHRSLSLLFGKPKCHLCGSRVCVCYRNRILSDFMCGEH